MTPSLAVREDFLEALAMPFLRSRSSAFSRSPSALDQRLLAVHHACVGLVAQLFNLERTNFGHRKNRFKFPSPADFKRRNTEKWKAIQRLQRDLARIMLTSFVGSGVDGIY